MLTSPPPARPHPQLPAPSALTLALALVLALVLPTSGCRPNPAPPGPAASVVAGMNRGVGLMGQYLYEDAVAAFEAVATEAPDLIDARINLAIARFNRNRQTDLATATQLLESVLQQDPTNVRALYFHAIVLQHAGQAEQAIPCLEKVLGARPSDGAAWYLLALCKQRTGQSAEAEFLRAVQHRPYLYSAYYQLYQNAMREGREGPAREYLERFKTLRESPLGESLEFPQYNQMGDLALALPLPTSPTPPVATSKYQFGAPRPLASVPSPGAPATPSRQVPLAAGDFNQDGRLDLLFATSPPGSFTLLQQDSAGTFTDATTNAGLHQLPPIVAAAIGDFDNDEHPDLCLTTPQGALLLRQDHHRFVDVTRPAGLDAGAGPFRSSLFLDADHDGDLDLLVCGKAVNQLWNNNGNGSFTNLAATTALECPGLGSTHAVSGDLDGDRDMDLIIFREDGPARIFLNELFGQFRPVDLPGVEVRGEAGAVLQDLTGDGVPDLLALGGNPPRLQLWRGDGHGGFVASEAFASLNPTLDSWGPLTGFRVADLDLDGDLEILGLGTAAHALLNDGRGRFVVQAQAWTPPAGSPPLALEVLDLNGDLVPDLVALAQRSHFELSVSPGDLTPPSTALALLPSGVRGRDGRTRSPANGYGTRLTARTGLREQRLLFTGQTGGWNQSLLPVVLGLGGAPKADFVQLAWPDGVAQVETALPAGQTHKIAELQRKISSCPVLFAWDGQRFGFITDFAGVGGLGYFSAPGVSAPPQVLEHVKIEPHQLRAREGLYELRITEPMEEAAYIDRLELIAVDHPPGTVVFPDERLAISGPPPTHQLLVVEQPWFPTQALDPDGQDCTDSILRVDRRYAYPPKLDRRYFGFCPPHSLILDWADRLLQLPPDQPLFLFLNGFIEYPYSQTVYAASQSQIAWEPIRIDAQTADGTWHTVVPDAGVPGGMARMMTADLSGLVPVNTRRLRLTTNLEIHYDQVFLAPALTHTPLVRTQTAPLRHADLRYVGFAREYSPDGQPPLIFDYELSDATAPFHVLKGAYTRYGPVVPLLKEFDDQYVLMGPGDEIALQFDAASLAPPPPGFQRSFLLVSHAYCKDMDLYTATPQTLEPLPFQSMSRYPYPATERYPDSAAHRRYREFYNTRRVE